MYAVIGSSGKQYRVQAGDVIRVEKLRRDVGTEFDLTSVLFLQGKESLVGTPEVSGAKVTLRVTRQSKAAKIRVFKKKRRKGYKRTRGHRQSYTELLVKEITAPHGEVSRIEEVQQNKEVSNGIKKSNGEYKEWP